MIYLGYPCSVFHHSISPSKQETRNGSNFGTSITTHLNFIENIFSCLLRFTCCCLVFFRCLHRSNQTIKNMHGFLTNQIHDILHYKCRFVAFYFLFFPFFLWRFSRHCEIRHSSKFQI